jgi:hypothetical protein
MTEEQQHGEMQLIMFVSVAGVCSNVVTTGTRRPLQVSCDRLSVIESSMTILGSAAVYCFRTS